MMLVLLKMRQHPQCLKITQKVAFEFWNFGIFYELLSTENVNVARFARNVEWDFFCDFQTPWGSICYVCIKNKPCCRSLMNILCEMHLAKDIRSTPFCWGPNRVDKSAWGHRILKIIPRFNPITWRIRTMSKFWLKVCF